jgi:hypothetical protein
VTGVVSDSSGPLPGVNLIVKGTKQSAQTDMVNIMCKLRLEMSYSFLMQNDRQNSGKEPLFTVNVI